MRLSSLARNNFGSFATLAAIRRASSFVSRFDGFRCATMTRLSATVRDGISRCVVADGDIDNDQRLDSVRIAPAANDQNACPPDDNEMRTLVAASTAEVMEVLTDVPDIDKNVQTLGTLAQNLKQDPATGLRSSETKVGQRTVQMLVTLGGRRTEFVISPE